MKIRSSLIAAIALFAGITFCVVSCKKDNSSASQVSDSDAQTISQENTAAEGEYDDITEMGLSAGTDMEAGAITNGRIATDGNTSRIRLDLFVNLALKLGPCVNISATPNDSTYPKTVTIDYGTGCLCADGKFRKGAIVMNFSAPIHTSGAVLTITFRDFYVHDVHIEGVKTIANLSANGTIKFSVKIADGKVTWPNGRGFTYNGTKVITQIEGKGTISCSDDIYSIEVNTTIKYANGITVTKVTQSPLIKAVSCHWISKGVLKISINDRVVYVDFGAGDCDNKATLTWAKGSVEITL